MGEFQVGKGRGYDDVFLYTYVKFSKIKEK